MNIYNVIYNHFEDSKECLSHKQTLWKTQMCEALNAALAKHLKYYIKTYHTEDYIYVIAAILDPFKKLTIFDEKSWKNDITD